MIELPYRRLIFSAELYGRMIACLEPERHASLSLIAMALMLFDHAAIAFMPNSWMLHDAMLRWPGRFSMPAFAILAAAYSSSAPVPKVSRYINRLIVLALVSEPIYEMFPGGHVNALFPLFVGSYTLMSLRCRAGWRAVIANAIFIAVCLWLKEPEEIFYAMLVIGFGVTATRWRYYGIPLIAVAVFMMNTPFFAIQSIVATVLVLWVPLPGAPRMPDAFRRWFYPTHLAILWAMSKVFV